MRSTSALILSLVLAAAVVQPSLSEEAQKDSHADKDSVELSATAAAEPWEQARHQTEMMIAEKK